MPILHVKSAAYDSPSHGAAAGNREPLRIIISVTTADGEPVVGLTAAHFQFYAEQVAPGGAEVRPTEVYGAHTPGFYGVDVVPVRDYTWRAGMYIFGIAVTSHEGRGQELCSVRVM